MRSHPMILAVLMTRVTVANPMTPSRGIGEVICSHPMSTAVLVTRVTVVRRVHDFMADGFRTNSTGSELVTDAGCVRSYVIFAARG